VRGIKRGCRACHLHPVCVTQLPLGRHAWHLWMPTLQHVLRRPVPTTAPRLVGSAGCVLVCMWSVLQGAGPLVLHHRNNQLVLVAGWQTRLLCLPVLQPQMLVTCQLGSGCWSSCQHFLLVALSWHVHCLRHQSCSVSCLCGLMNVGPAWRPVQDCTASCSALPACRVWN
jgi:hypothetical protein